MIVGTAGHIDHGKTTLVRALTGVDTDRLPEEKRRGISIELGYAYLDTHTGTGSSERIGFIDVPGHERLVATMLAGATGIDFALLLVAADDGPMPQTREHLAALSLLGIARATVVVTKADRVDAARVDAVRGEARALVAASRFAAAPILVVSAATGRGIEALRALLVEAAGAQAAQRAAVSAAAGFRLAVDRVFTLAGAGTVVTGTAHAGRVAVGDVLALAPGAAEPMRVRSLRAQNTDVQAAEAGQRIAIGLAGVAKNAVARGDWLVSPEVALASSRIDARIEVWHGEGRPLRSGQRVHLHGGAADGLASVAVLEPAGDAIAPGAGGVVQLVCHTPVAAWRGDRLVLRDASASRTIAGGDVLDPFAPTRYRRTPERLRALAGLAQGAPAARLGAALAAAPHGLDLAAFRRAEGALDGPALPLPPETLEVRSAAGHWALAAAHAVAVRAGLQRALAAFHRSQPEEPGPDAARLRRLAAPRLPLALWAAAMEEAQAAGEIGLRTSHCFLPSHEARLSAAEQRLLDKSVPRLLAGGFDPPWLRTLAADLREPEPLLRAALLRAARRGVLHPVVKDLYYPRATLVKAAALVRGIAGREGEVTAAAFRDASGLGRKRAIQIVEYFDRVGLLRRVADVHRLREECTLFDEAASP